MTTYEIEHCQKYAETIGKLRRPDAWDTEVVMADIRQEIRDAEVLAMVDYLLERVRRHESLLAKF